FFCQAEDGIRDDLVTGVQTCALPISVANPPSLSLVLFAARGLQISELVGRVGRAFSGSCDEKHLRLIAASRNSVAMLIQICEQQIGRASCREKYKIHVAIKR